MAWRKDEVAILLVQREGVRVPLEGALSFGTFNVPVLMRYELHDTAEPLAAGFAFSRSARKVSSRGKCKVRSLTHAGFHLGGLASGV